MPDILVTMPAYNEEKTIATVIEGILKIVPTAKVLVVSDGSTDNTTKEAKKTGATVIEKAHSGLADTFRMEMRIAYFMKPDVIVHTDADGQYIASDMLKLIDEVLKGTDLVLGSRLKGHIAYMPKSKRSTNVLGTFLIKQWLRADITDATTGFRAFNVKVAKLPINSEYTYTVEQLIKAKKAGLRIKSVPISFVKREDGESRLMSSPANYILQTIKNTRRMLS